MFNANGTLNSFLVRNYHLGIHGPAMALGNLLAAKAARRLHEALNHPGDAAMTRTLMIGHITDTHITAKDVALAEKIMGPCPAWSLPPQ
jgi:hypothetical protein